MMNCSRKPSNFLEKIVFLETLALYGRAEDNKISLKFSGFFNYLTLGNFWSQLLFKIPNFDLFSLHIIDRTAP